MIERILKVAFASIKKNVAISVSVGSAIEESQPYSHSTSFKTKDSRSATLASRQDSYIFAHHIWCDSGVQIVNLQLAFIPITNTAAFDQLAETALFIDEQGIAVKIQGKRKYFLLSD